MKLDSKKWLKLMGETQVAEIKRDLILMLIAATGLVLCILKYCCG